MQKAFCKNILEVACFDVRSCLLAQEAGADRIEFCSDYAVGGTTPLHEDILKVKNLLQIPLHVIIRPRGGSFIYTVDELQKMRDDILFCKKNHIDGIVFGILNSDKKVDIKKNKELIELAGSMSTTFHRAIDECNDLLRSMNELIELKFKRVLTSGGKQHAMEGISVIKSLQEKFGEAITVIPGGGIRSSNITQIMNETHCREFHSAAITDNTSSVDTREIKRLLEKLKQ